MAGGVNPNPKGQQLPRPSTFPHPKLIAPKNG